ncbi:hypothetical protein J5226_02910 [Lysobacter sp. K5869]|uniref:hypothetical protein n=1 Tax=Lysobacter sp. K5869 TaxID=2820808 RepID=UPI001C063A3F|nr:hypothetical protein [Lysobacter sp. K5869]QWP77373.1 hypothetical protein J5226_02910 [Lysobacter sp. K5869]
MPFRFALFCLFAALSLHAGAARAGASLYVDDAATVARGRCQLESWLRGAAPAREFTLAPACDVAGTELGLSHSDYAAPHAAAAQSLSAKRVLRASAQGWALAASLSANWSGGRYDGWTFNLPLTLGPDPNGPRLWHLNLGWNQPRQGRARLTGGVGLEQALSARWTALAELYADAHGDAGGQLGLRRALSDDASFDLLLGDRERDPRGPWLTLGFNLALR